MAKTITHKIGNDETTTAMFGDQDHLEYAQGHSFSQTIFEALVERQPSENETKLLDLILNLSFDHGPNSPSSSKTIEEAKEGEAMGEAVGEGIEQINEHHGGAGEPLMEALYRIKNEEFRIQNYVEQNIQGGKRVPGLGHRVYKDKDPRAELIMEKALQLGVGGDFIGVIREIRGEVEKQTGKSLAVNIDGAIAAVFCGFGLEPKAATAIFIIARTVGLTAHYMDSSK